MKQKGFAGIYLLILGIVIGAIAWGMYLNFATTGVIPSPFNPTPTPAPTLQPVACTQEAKVCPDGSSVGRTGTNCEFSPCSTSTIVPIIPSIDKTRCSNDSECGVNTCSCTAQRKDSLGKVSCAMMCVGKVECINNQCVFVKNN